MSRNKYDLPIHRLLGNVIDISLVWHLFLDGDNTVIINGQKVVYYCPMADYIELEKHYYAYRGANRIFEEVE